MFAAFVPSRIPSSIGTPTKLFVLSLDVIDPNDHQLVITDIEGSTVFLDQVSGTVLRSVGNDGKLATGPRDERITISASAKSGIELQTSGGNDVIRVDNESFAFIDGGDGFDVAELAFASVRIGSAGFDFRNIEKIELVGAETQSIVLDPESVFVLTAGSGTLVAEVGADDSVQLGDGWTATDVVFREGTAFHQLEFDSTVLELANQLPWTNPLIAADVDRNGFVTSLDALQIINRLARQGDDSRLPSPSDSNVVVSYFDVNSDDNATALDALQVINFIGRQPPGEAELLAPIQNIANDVLKSDTISRLEATFTGVSDLSPTIGFDEAVSQIDIPRTAQGTVQSQPSEMSELRSLDQAFSELGLGPDDV